MVATATPAATPAQDSRRHVRVDGQHALTDVARRMCGDARLAALLKDLNPTLPEAGLLPAGTVVVCPGKAEAAAFARKMGFTLGFDPKSSNGTGARRAFAKHCLPGAAASRLDAAAFSRSLIARGIAVGEAARRLAKQCALADITALTTSTDPALRQLALHAEAHALFPKAQTRIAATRSVLDATARPAGLRALIEALAKDGAGGARLLGGAAVAPALIRALVDSAGPLSAALARATEIANQERGVRDLLLAREPNKGALQQLVAALVDGVEPLAGDRPAALGCADELEALQRHLEMLRAGLKQAEDGLGRQSADVIRSLARGLDGATLGRPWPLLCQVVRDIGAAIDAVPTTACDLGFGGLLKRHASSTEGTPVRLTAAEMQVRAAACARAMDEGDAFSERLAPVIVELFGFMRPPPAVDGGTVQARKLRRKGAFDHAMVARGEVTPEGVAALAAEVVERARQAGNAAAVRQGRAQAAALEEAARAMSGALSVHRHPMSELGRALVVAAMALDREVGQGLSRPTGREAFVAAATRHAGRVLSAASCALGA